MASSQRRCSTCRHFQPAPIWRKGWCRNPALYAPHQNHLVDERELDCDRPFGDYWEPLAAPAPAPVAPTAAPIAAQPSPAGAETTATPAPPAAGAAAVDPMVVVRPPRRAATAAPAPTPTPAPAPAPAPSRADYLRLGVPAATILILLTGYALWTGLLLRSAATPLTPTAIVRPTLPPTAPPTQAPLVLPTAAPSPAPTSPPPAPTVPPATATTAPAGLRVGAAAVVDTEGLRLRREPGRAGPVIRALRPGERLVLLEGPRDEDGQAWWRVEVGGTTGWVAAAFIRPQ